MKILYFDFKRKAGTGILYGYKKLYPATGKQGLEIKNLQAFTPAGCNWFWQHLLFHYYNSDH